ncbi:MAG: putative diacylglycerol O-acyltransferase [Acidimicrobiales bacterium]|nr:MAG: DUF1298 domain-containing protein [Actinomycetota bacterium]MBV6508972.1 putative diacylglycerol O-acyltransferase [Acidimicrobiales bacterium]RIK08393.1 MAG: diacylglycerol O-acyltransferase [Acidobacteriota bacterium]
MTDEKMPEVAPDSGETAGAAPTDGDTVEFPPRMSDADSVMWSIEKDPMLRSTILTLAVFDRPIDRARFVHTIDRATRVIPRLRQRVRSNPLSLAPPRWEVDPHFDLDYHLRFARPAGNGTMRELLQFAEPIAMQGFDRARPLWEMTVVDGLEEERSAVLMKIHHSITDGVGGMKLQLELFDLEPDAPEKPLPAPPPVHVMDQRERFIDAMTHETRRYLGMLKRNARNVIPATIDAAAHPRRSAESVLDTLGSMRRLMAPVTAPLSPIMERRSLSVHFDTLTVPLRDAKNAAKAVGGKLNDAFVGGVVLGLHKYHELHGAECCEVHMSMPINIRNDDSANVAGNSFVPTRFTVPISFSGAAETVRAIHERVRSVREEPALDLVDPMANVITRLPTTILTQVFGSMMKGMDLTTSNVPGAPFAVYLSGARLEAQYAFGPLAGAAMNITLLSYIDELNIGINLDPVAVPDADALLKCFAEGFEEVLALAR